MPTPQQIAAFKVKARAAGKSEAEIVAEIARKTQEEARAAVQPGAKPVSPTPVVPTVTPPAASSPITSVAKPQPQNLLQKAGNVAKSVGSAIIKPVIGMGQDIGAGAANLLTGSDTVAQQGQQERIQQAHNLTTKGYELINQGKIAQGKKLIQQSLGISGEVSQQEGAKAIENQDKQVQAVKNAAGTGALLVPGGSTGAGRIASATTQGALSGFGASEKGKGLQGAVGGGIGGAAVGGAMEVLAPVAGKALSAIGSKTNRAINKMLSPFGSQFDTEIATLAAQKGVDLPASAKTSSNFVKQVEAISQKSFWGGNTTKKIINAHNQINKLAEDLTTELAQPVDKKSVGDIVKRGFEKFAENFNKTKTAMYDAVPETIGVTPAITENTKDILQKIQERRGQSLVPNSSSFFDDILEKLQPVEGANIPSETLGLTYDTLKQTRTDIGTKLKNFNDPIATGDKANLKSLYAALSDDLEETIKVSDPESYKLIEEANNFYRDNIQKINSKVGEQIKNADPEKLLDTLVKPNSETQIAMVKQVLDKDSVENLQQGFVSKMFDESIDRKKGTINIDKLRTQIKKYGDGTIKELLDPEQYDKLQSALVDLEDIQKIQTALQQGTKAAEGSQTAFLLNTGGAASLFAMSPAAALTYVLGQGAIVKGLESKTGQKLLGEGVGQITEIGGQKLSQPISQLIQKLTGKFAGVVGGAVGADSAGATPEQMQTVNDLTQTDPTMPPEGTDVVPVQGGDQPLAPQQDTLPPTDTVPENAGIFGGMTKQQVLEKGFRAGLNSKQLDEIEKVYDRMAPTASTYGSMTIKELTSTRKELVDQGFDTGAIDSELKSRGLSRSTTEKTGKEPSATVAKQRALGQSGLRALDELEGLIKDDPSVVAKALLPGKLGARQYDAAAHRAVEGLLRARSGAAVPETEVRRYMDSYLPIPGDGPAAIKAKLAAFKQDLEDQANFAGGSDTFGDTLSSAN
jgi:hypothetical protein